jgi:hypothetical protein
VIPITDFTSLHQQFFAYGKKYLLQMIIHGYFKERFFLNQYFYGIPASREIVIEKYKKF